MSFGHQDSRASGFIPGDRFFRFDQTHPAPPHEWGFSIRRNF
jgi:hypothetical protein